MAEKDLGIKLTCKECGAKFFDLKKKLPVCPKCAAEQPAPKPKVRRAPPTPVAAPAKPAAEEATETDDEIDPKVDDTLIATDDDDEDGDVVTAAIIDTVEVGKDGE